MVTKQGRCTRALVIEGIRVAFYPRQALHEETHTLPVGVQVVTASWGKVLAISTKGSTP